MHDYLFFGAIILLIVISLIIGAIASAKRNRELTALAERTGLFFAPDSGDAHLRYERFLPFGRGSSQRTANLLHGPRGRFHWEMFDYRFRTGSGKNRRTHRYGIAVATLPGMYFHKLTMRPEGFVDKVASLAGFGDINFESHEFSRRYHVSCDVRKYAYDLIHPQMIEYLLGCSTRHWQLYGDVILIHTPGRFSAHELEDVMATVEGFIERIPAYVQEDAKLNV
jgi:hypothetical protein